LKKRIGKFMSAAIHSILVPLDGSSFSQKAVAYGIYFAQRINVPLIGLYPGDLQEDSSAAILVQTFREDCRRSGISPDLRSCSDLSAPVILEAAKEKKGSLFLIPRPEAADSHLDHPAGSFLVATAEARMIIPGKFREIESMGLIYDGSPETGRALDLAVDLSRKAFWPLTILLVSEDFDRIAALDRQLDDYFEGHAGEAPIDWDIVALGEPTERTVLQFIRDGSIELLVLGHPGQDTDPDKPPLRILRESPIPLLVIS